MFIKIIISTSIFLILALSGYQYYSASPSANNEYITLELQNKNSDDTKNITTASRWSIEIQEIIRNLKNQYSSQIHHIHIQAKLITIREPLINQLDAPIPENMKGVLATVFPSYENSILNVWSRMDEYQKWLTTQNRTLMELNALSRSGMLWDKRNELFPIAANDIWSEEQDNYETAQLNFHSTIDQLDQYPDVPMNERIERLQTSFQQADNAFTRTLEQQSGIHKNTIASVLFGLTSVQNELKNLDPEHRQLEINAVRRELGYDEESIIKMSTTDSKREQRWSNGYAYMESRDQLMVSNEQPSKKQLNVLRNQFFGNSAQTIEREEASGFYRFQRPRYYGRN
jgi:hypothetical protein